MKKLSFLEKLLDGSEIEWKPLGEILVRTQGTKITAKRMQDLNKNNAPIKIFAGGKTVAFVNSHDIPEKDIRKEPSIIVKSRGIIEFEYYDKYFSHKSEMWSYYSNNENIDIKYIYYFLKNNEKYFQNLGSKMQMPQISIPDTDKYQIPIPCPADSEKSLEIQKEIARILDGLTEKTQELRQQLASERKLHQDRYTYHRDKLFTFEGIEIEWKPLGDIAVNKNSMRKPITSELRKKGQVPYYGASGVVDYVQDYIFDGDFLLISEDGANLLARKTPIAFSISGKNWVNNHAHVLEFKTSEERKYIEYYLNSIDLMPYISGIAQPKLNKKNLEIIKIPIPYPNDSKKSLAEQKQIVDILDNLTEKTTQITDAITEEIMLHQQRYEYYRNSLFDFPQEKKEI